MDHSEDHQLELVTKVRESFFPDSMRLLALSPLTFENLFIKTPCKTGVNPR